MLIGIGKGQLRQFRHIDFQDSQIRLRIGSEDLCRELSLITEFDFDFCRVFDNMIVCQDITVGGYDKSGTLAAWRYFFWGDSSRGDWRRKK